MSAWYGAILEEQGKSGLSVKDYAVRKGMSRWTLYEWRRRLSSVADAAAEKPRLVEVAIGPGETRVADPVVRVCDGRRSIEVPCGFDSDELRRLIGVLESC